jgi:ribonuclease HII
VLLIGIDEAGYGPLLGPLCHGYCAIRVPDSEEPPCLWKMLRPAVARHGKKRGVVIDDSKKVYTAGGLESLARGVAAFLHCEIEHPAETPLYHRLLPQSDRERLEEDHWGRTDDCGLRISDCGLDESLAKLRAALGEKGVAVAAVGARALSAKHFNASLAASSNKADVNWTTIAEQLLALAILAREGENIHAVIDRQGGRKFYTGQLSALFPGAMAWVEKETPNESVYRLEWEGRTVRIVFLVDAETHVFPVALSSMCAKLARELCMARLNAYFRTHAPELRPTAGYYGDAGRFLRETRELRQKLAIEDHVFVRAK